jgi:hypothetical protein
MMSGRYCGNLVISVMSLRQLECKTRESLGRKAARGFSQAEENRAKTITQAHAARQSND